MARFRIIERNSFIHSGVPWYDVKERYWFWWEWRGTYDTLAGAELRVAELQTVVPVKRKVVKEYN
jgi:hypothetical protein